MPDTPPHTRTSLEALLRTRAISFSSHEHPPVFTVAEADAATGHLPGAPTKNLFLRDNKGHRHLLVTVSAEHRVNLQLLADALGIKKLGFASPERLRERLGIEPGSVTLLALVNDPEHRVECIIDTMVWEADAVQCHPLVNSATLVVSKGDLMKFFELTGHQPTVLAVPRGEG